MLSASARRLEVGTAYAASMFGIGLPELVIFIAVVALVWWLLNRRKGN